MRESSPIFASKAVGAGENAPQVRIGGLPRPLYSQNLEAGSAGLVSKYCRLRPELHSSATCQSFRCSEVEERLDGRMASLHDCSVKTCRLVIVEVRLS